MSNLSLYLIEALPTLENDYYRNAVVVARNPSHAALMHPDGRKELMPWNDRWPSWVNQKDQVKVTYLGVAHHKFKRGVICANKIGE